MSSCKVLLYIGILIYFLNVCLIAAQNSDYSSQKSDSSTSNSGHVLTPQSPSNSSDEPLTKKEKICFGTNAGMTHPQSEVEWHNMLKRIYTNCTYVDGNLEIVFTQAQDLSFLKDIREVTGYVLIVANLAQYIPLDSLMIIRGRTLHYMQHEKRYYSLYVAMNYQEEKNKPSIGLMELRFTKLHEILAGNVFIYYNPLLCYDDKINWKDIMTGEGAQLYWDESSKKARTCGECDESCSGFNGTRHCWGSGPEHCQKLTKLSCSPQCDGRCFGPLPNQCCHPECAAGCNGPGKDQCWACKNFDNDGTCEHFCPQEMIYSHKYYKNIPNPDAKYSYGAICVKKCPSHLIADHGSCVQDCGAGRVAQGDKCVDCDGPCPKTCEIDIGTDFINSGNIHLYAGCTVIKGNIRILPTSFENDEDRDLPPLEVEQLSVLETVQEVTGYVQVQAYNPKFTNLSFFKNLKIIHGRGHVSGSSLQIFLTSLVNLGLESLEKIRFGKVFIANNTRLCYADTINWKKLNERDDQKIIVHHNRPAAECVADLEVCSSECTNEGCWGPRDLHCMSCKHFHLGRRCLGSCSDVAGVYQANATHCRYCHPECEGGCRGEEADKCDTCRNARDGPYCVSECPKSKYKDENSVCQMCHANCEGGCTGPRNTVGEGGCTSCLLVEFLDDRPSASSCLPPESNCSDGYYRAVLSGQTRGQAVRQACMRCHPECRTCFGSGLQFCESCKHFTEEGRCVSQCSSNHYLDVETLTCHKCDPRCLRCLGPTADHCMECKEYKLYADYENRDKNKSFTCTDQCPEDYPHTAQVNVEDSSTIMETICTKDNLEHERKKKFIYIGVASGLVASVIILILVIYFLRRRYKSQNMKKKLTDRIKVNTDITSEPLFVSEAKPDMASLPLINESDLVMGDPIGSGAFGTVFKGTWTNTRNHNQKMEVAVKILRDGTSYTQTKELFDEARIMASVNHPCCTEILAVCLSMNVMLITKLHRHGCLLDYIRKTWCSLGSDTLLRWCEQIAEGMKYLESKQIVHRDLAARNVLVESREQVKITDFGLAKLLIDEEKIRFTGGKMPIRWLALECLNQRIFTHKSDVWSYGVTVWELLTFGQRPYDQMKTADIPVRLEEGLRLPMPKFCRDPIYDLMKQCWNKDPEKRPTFSELVMEFRNMRKNPELYIDLQRHDLRPDKPSQSSMNGRTSRQTSRQESGIVSDVSLVDYLVPQSSRPGASHRNPLPLVLHSDDELADDVFEVNSNFSPKSRGRTSRNGAHSPIKTPQPNSFMMDSNNFNNMGSYPQPRTEYNNLNKGAAPYSVEGLRNNNLLPASDIEKNYNKNIIPTRLNGAEAPTGSEGTPVWKRRQNVDVTRHGSVGEERREHDDYLHHVVNQPHMANQPTHYMANQPVQRVDLLNGHHRPVFSANGQENSARKSPDFSSAANVPHSPNWSGHPTTPPNHPTYQPRGTQNYAEVNPFLAQLALPVRINHDSSDSNRSSSILEGSEPDYYNDFGEPLSAVPLLPPRLESPL